MRWRPAHRPSQGHGPQEDARWALPGLWRRRPNDCGPCCLSMVARYHGLSCGVGLASRLSGWRWWSGTSLLGLAQAANQMGLTSLSARISAKALSEIPLPCIAHLRPNHFVVVCEVDPQTVHVTDPLGGQKRMSFEEFTSLWGGVVLLLWPMAGIAPNVGNELSVPSIR